MSVPNDSREKPAADPARPTRVAHAIDARAAAERWVVVALIAFGTLDFSALAAAAFPHSWMDAVHRACGLGDLPRVPIVGYLARTASLLYALHGAMILFVANDVQRYWPLIRFLALAAIAHGALLVLIDVLEDMPTWWKATEGLCIAATGAAVLFLQRRADAISA